MKIKPFPFYWRIKADQCSHSVIPEELSYTFAVEKNINLMIEKRNQELLDTLHLMYQQNSNIGFLQDGHNLAKSYGEDFLNVLTRIISDYAISNALEIGCGGCYLLERMSNLGINAIGIDPSPVAHEKSTEKGLEVIDSFYPSVSFNKRFDLIYHVDVLEHVTNPISFLKEHLNNLTSEGMIVVNVPDNTHAIQIGDISLASHQHLNSFDELSLYKCFDAAGFKTIDIIKSKFGSSLYGVASPKSSIIETSYQPTTKENTVYEFFNKARFNIERFDKYVKKINAEGKTLGFYMPLRAFPYIATAGIEKSVRLFDDINHWHNGYIGSSTNPIENFDDFCQDPVDHLFIMSHSFGNKLKEKILKQNPNQQVTLLSDFLMNNNRILEESRK